MALKEGKRSKLEDLQGLLNRRDPEVFSATRKKDSEGRRKPGELVGSEGKEESSFISPGAHEKGWMREQRPLMKLRKEKVEGFLFVLFCLSSENGENI